MFVALVHASIALPASSTAGAAVAAAAASSLGARVRSDFKLLDQDIWEGKRLVYLDSAATSQKPASVVRAMTEHLERDNANVHRGAHSLAARSTASYESARDKVAAFVGAADRREIVFTRGATEAINLVANTWGVSELGAGDEVVLSVMEHHSNMVPWQQLAKSRGVILKYARLDALERLDLEHLRSLLGPRTRLVSIAHVSNTLGCVNPVKEIAALAHAVGAKLLVDACQSVPHMPIDVRELGCDFLVASGHKMCGPTGIGFLWGRLELLEAMPPWQGGGEMIDTVTLEGVTYALPPGRFEAGTPAITQAIGLGAACDYLRTIGMAEVQAYEHELAAHLHRGLSAIPGIRIYGPPVDVATDAAATHAHRAALCAFNIEGVHASDLATFLDQEGIAIRAGHHCTQPLHHQLGAAGSARASLYLYNTHDEIDALCVAIAETVDMLRMLEDV
jgi:cysteine desulfurase/selenocysteine lyase